MLSVSCLISCLDYIWSIREGADHGDPDERCECTTDEEADRRAIADAGELASAVHECRDASDEKEKSDEVPHRPKCSVAGPSHSVSDPLREIFHTCIKRPKTPDHAYEITDSPSTRP